MREYTDARLSTAEALAQELDVDMTPEFLNSVDKFLAQLWMRGYKIAQVTAEDCRQPEPPSSD